MVMSPGDVEKSLASDITRVEHEKEPRPPIAAAVMLRSLNVKVSQLKVGKEVIYTRTGEKATILKVPLQPDVPF